MSFRDDDDAVRSRADALQREVDAARAELALLHAEREENVALRAQLQAAERKLAALQGSRRSSSGRWLLLVFAGTMVVSAGGGALFYVAGRGDAEPPAPPVAVHGPAALLPRGLAALARVGVGAAAIDTLRTLDVHPDEIDKLAQLKRAGAADETCVELVRASRADDRRPLHGAAAASLLRAGVSQGTLVALARLDQLGWAPNVIAMRQAGVADPTIWHLAQLRARARLSLTGAAVARLRQAGLGDEAIVGLVDKGVREDHVAALVAQRQRGLSDAQILAQFRGAQTAEAE